ncbi:hypothetical protein HPP92_016451 [Vanilla planifolia]|uniref:Transcription factor MYC/MYB N-terminal domain-containing protein n=1 Tax=Vanilla planifolia TaxID=51239 RepID=A0A835QEU6_VANPL|nr:hypothetical protein HPP92_016451 [Vanilla planifolia]
MNHIAISHLLQHTLRGLCIHESSPWLYAVFWRILPRSFPPPKWDVQGGAFDGARGNTWRNWILAWEDGFCNFAASSMEPPFPSSSTARNLQPELFFKMSHEIYNYGEGLIGKVAADRSYKWVYNEPPKQEANFLPSCSNVADSLPRTWEAQFQSGIKTIALIAIGQGVVQLGAEQKVVEDVGFVVSLRKKFAYLETIPGVLLPHPSSSIVHVGTDVAALPPVHWPPITGTISAPAAPQKAELYHPFGHTVSISPSIGSLEALLSKLPSVGPVVPGPAPAPLPLGCSDVPLVAAGSSRLARAFDAEEIVVEEHEYAAVELNFD